MKKLSFLALLVALLAALCACTQGQSSSGIPEPPSENIDQQPSLPDTPDTTDPEPGDNGGSEPPLPPALDDLTVELVVEWEAADAILSQLDELAVDLQTALDKIGCNVDRVTITISTAGGFTAQSLIQGGVDAAILPALDCISHENEIAIIALSGETPSETAIAVSKADTHLTDAFHSALLQALTETESGQELLNVCCPDTEFFQPTEDALQLVRDRFAELEENEGGHEA